MCQADKLWGPGLLYRQQDIPQNKGGAERAWMHYTQTRKYHFCCEYSNYE